METMNILWWHYPMIGIGVLLFANSVVALSALPRTISSKLLWISQLAVAVSFMFYPMLKLF